MCSNWPPKHVLFSKQLLLVLFICQSLLWKWPCLIPRAETRAGLRVSSVVLWRRTWIWPPDLGRPLNHLLSPSFDNSPFSGTFVNLSSMVTFEGLTWLGVSMGNGRTSEGGWLVGSTGRVGMVLEQLCLLFWSIGSARMDKTTTEHLGFARSNWFVPWESLLSTDLSCR